MKHRVQFLGRRPCLPDLTPAGLRNVDHELPESLGMTLDCLSCLRRLMSCYASANCRSECATYQAVCGKRATLLSNAQDGRNRLSGRNVKRSAIRAWGQYHSRVIGSTGGECGQLRRRHSGKGRAVPERLPVDPYFVMRALSAANASGVCAVRSEIENYRAKAKKFARLAAVAKSPRH